MVLRRKTEISSEITGITYSTKVRQMSYINLTILPEDKKTNNDAKYNRHKAAYLKGKADASSGLDRTPPRAEEERDCYNMGYSYGVL